MRRAWLYLLFALIALLALLAISTGGAAQPALVEGTPTAIGRGGAVATVEELASGAAVGALRDGANAVDAAVVAAAVLGVTEPFSCGIGGGGFMVIRTSDRRVSTIDTASPRRLRSERIPSSRTDAVAVQRRPLQRPICRCRGR